MKKKYVGWIVKLDNHEEDPAYWAGEADDGWPYSSHQRHAIRFTSRVDAELAVQPRIDGGRVWRNQLSIHRLYRWVEA